MVSLIGNLPVDVILHIFVYMDGQSLKNSTLVCKLWNDLICGTSKITKNFSLNLCDNKKWHERLDEVMSLTRRFQSMNVRISSSLLYSPDGSWISKSEYFPKLLVEISAKHGSQIRKLGLNFVEFDSPAVFLNLLSNMPLLSELELTRVRIFENRNTEQATLTNLTKLTVNTCDLECLVFFLSSPIKELHMTNTSVWLIFTEIEHYMRFLRHMLKLESIELDLMSYHQTFKTQVHYINFKLKRLKYLSYPPVYETDDIHTNFGTFLQYQGSSLKELELNDTSPNVIKIIFTKLKVLEKLRIYAKLLPDNADFYSSFKKMVNLKEFILHDDITSEISVKETLRNCQNLETLTAYHDPHQHVTRTLPFIAENCPLLKHLSLDFLSEASSDLKFNHLKFLHIQSCIDFECLFTFLNNNHTIDTLSLNLVSEKYIPDDSTLEALLNQPNILHLIIAAGYNTLDNIYSKVKIDYRKLKSLEMRQLTTAMKDNILIKFPNDKSQWQPRDLFN